MVTIINELVDGKIFLQYKYHHWLIRNVLIRILTNRELWITVHHCAKQKKTSIICVAIITAYRGISRVWLTRFEQRLKRRWIFERASGNHCLLDAGKTRPPRKQQLRQRWQQQQSWVNTPEDKVQLQKEKRLPKDRIWTMIPGRHTTRDSHLQECLLRHHCRRHSEEARAKWIGKRIHVWGLVALPLPQKLQICWLGDIRSIRRPQVDYSAKDDELRKIPYKSTIHLHRGLSTRSLLYCRSWTGNCTEAVHTRAEGRQTFPVPWEAYNLSSSMGGVYNVSRQQCQRSRSNYRYKEIEGESSNSLTTWAKCTVLNSLVRNTETNFGRHGLSHHYVTVYAGRMRCKSCQRK